MPRSSTPARCVYREGNARCRRNGQGQPALCRAHREVFEHVAHRDERPGATVIGVLRDLFSGKQVSNDRMAAAAVDGFDLFARYRTTANIPGAGAPPPRGFPGAWPFGGAARPNSHMPPPRPPPPPRQDEGARHRSTLGFPPGAVVTEDDVNRRRRELAVKFHPDKPGGSVAKMAEINAAADALLDLIAAEAE